MSSSDRAITTVFFDMDETLVEHTRSGVELCQDVFDAYAEALDGVEFELFMKTLWQKASDMWNMMFDGVLPGDVARVYSFKNTLRALEVDESLAEPMRETFESVMVDSTRLAPDAVSVLARLTDAGITVGMITNGYTSMQGKKIAHHGLDEMIEHVCISEAMGAHKPDARIFAGALERAGAEADKSAHVGDNLRADIAGAIGAGMHGILIDPEGARAKKLDKDPSLTPPTHIVSALGEVADWVGV